MRKIAVFVTICVIAVLVNVLSGVLAQTLTLQVGSPTNSGPVTPCGNAQLDFNSSPAGCPATLFSMGIS